ncbi:MAG: helix-turn-helix transcriptional regulator [Taibaiella sp.]|nr:helix-turn-helix transcriptional regulator [Taibaiella sp.]
MDIESRYRIDIREFGARLRQLRESKKLSQLDLEILCGINRTEISRIENGHKNIEFITLVKLALALEVQLFDLFEKK